MEFGGNGGLQGYHRLPQPVSGTKETEFSMDLPPQINHTVTSNSSAEDSEYSVREQNLVMPLANVVRLMRKILPPHAKISDDAKETMQECLSEFISFITGEANDHCQQERRRTITAEDLLFAMNKLGFDDYIEPLTIYLHQYREYDGGEHGSLRCDPMTNSTSDPVDYGLAPLSPAFVPRYHGYFQPAKMNSFPTNPSGAGPSQAAEVEAEAANLEQFSQDKE